ncbi:MAG TPA: hypothetical protein VFI45_12650 [Candidatus Acidoferrum sp.]|nr:hypothetical protein [Candidatus Acidoferrum sp.]
MKPAKLLVWLIILIAVTLPHLFALLFTFLIGSWFRMSAERARITYWVVDLLTCISAIIAYYRWRARLT